MKKEKTKKFFKILFLPALILTLSLTALMPNRTAKADSDQEFTLFNISKDLKAIGYDAFLLYEVTEEDVTSSKEIKVGDTLNNVYVLLDKSNASVSKPFVLSSSTGNKIETTSPTDTVNYTSNSVQSGIYSTTTNEYQLVYIEGNFGKVSLIQGKAYLYGGNINVKKTVQIGDKITATEFYYEIYDGQKTLFYSNNMHFLLQNNSAQCSVNGDPPGLVKNATSSSCGYRHYMIVFTDENFGEASLDSSSVITQIGEIELFTLTEVKANPEPQQPEPESAGPMGGGAGGGTIGNIDSTEEHPVNLNWLWYVGAGLLLCGGALFVISRR